MTSKNSASVVLVYSLKVKIISEEEKTDMSSFVQKPVVDGGGQRSYTHLPGNRPLSQQNSIQMVNDDVNVLLYFWLLYYVILILQYMAYVPPIFQYGTSKRICSRKKRRGGE